LVLPRQFFVALIIVLEVRKVIAFAIRKMAEKLKVESRKTADVDRR
jgi:hypothetical protein